MSCVLIADVTRRRCARAARDALLHPPPARNTCSGGHKFDFRSYLLIASTKPVLAFYADAFIRKSENAYSTDPDSLTDAKAHITNGVEQSGEDHFFNFEQLQTTLTAENGFPSDYIEKTFRPHAKRVTNFLANTAMNRTVLGKTGRPAGFREGFDKMGGRFQLFALDWMQVPPFSAPCFEAHAPFAFAPRTPGAAHSRRRPCSAKGALCRRHMHLRRCKGAEAVLLNTSLVLLSTCPSAHDVCAPSSRLRLDADGGIHLLEANGDPLVTHYPNTGLSPGVWNSCMCTAREAEASPPLSDPTPPWAHLAQGSSSSRAFITTRRASRPRTGR